MNTNAKRTVMRLVAGVAAVATLMGTAACGSSNSSSSDDNTLTVSYWDDEMQPIKDFIKANPDIKVKQIRVPGDDYNTKLNQMIVGGTAPDVMLTQEADYVRFAKNGVTMKLDDKLKDLGIDKSDFQPAVTDIANQVDGYYGFPQGFATEIMYYNKDMFDAAGVAYPTDDWTWDDYTAAAEKLTKADGSQYGSDSPTFNGVWYSLIGAAGDKVVDNGKLSFGNGLKKTLEFQKNLVDNKWQPQPASGSKVSDMFAAGKAAMTLGGTWLVSTYKDVDFKWDIATIPTAPGAKKYNSLHTSFWAINAKTKHSAAAEKLVKFLMSRRSRPRRSTACRPVHSRTLPTPKPRGTRSRPQATTPTSYRATATTRCRVRTARATGAAWKPLLRKQSLDTRWWPQLQHSTCMTSSMHMFLARLR